MQHLLERYRQTLRRRAQAHQAQLAQRYARAWEIARKAATLLKTDYGAKQVYVFGSLLSPRLFHSRSDIDLAVQGLDECHYYRAVSHLLTLDPTISVDLVEIERASSTLQEKIQREGKLL